MSVARPCGIYNKTYAQEFIIVRTKTQWVFLALGIALLMVFPLFVPSSILSVANAMGVTLIAVLGLHVLQGLCGQISVGQAAFMAVGAYTTAVMTGHFKISFFLAFPVSILVAGLIGLIAGLPSLRVKGFYLAMATLAAQVLIPWILSHASPEILGGPNGLGCDPISVFGLRLTEQYQMYFVIWLVALAGIYCTVNLTRSRIGRALVAVRDNDLAAEVMGINLFKYKLLAFFICSLFAGAAGSLYAVWTRFLSPDAFTLHQSILMLGMLIVGGMGSNAGAVLGVIFLAIVDELTKTFAPQVGILIGLPPASAAPALAPIAFGLIILLFLIFEPRGLAHRWEVFKAYYRLNPFSY